MIVARAPNNATITVSLIIGPFTGVGVMVGIGVVGEIVGSVGVGLIFPDIFIVLFPPFEYTLIFPRYLPGFKPAVLVLMVTVPEFLPLVGFTVIHG
jgi:hypothetical protein